QAIGEGNGGKASGAGGKGIDDVAGHIVRNRRVRQSCASCERSQQRPDCGGFIRAQGTGAIQTQGHRGGGDRFDQQGQCACCQCQPKANLAEQQTASGSCDPHQGQNQQRGLKAIEPAVPRPGIVSAD